MNNYRFSIIGKDGTKAMFRSIKAGLGGVRAGINSTQVKFAALAGVAGIGAMVKANLTAVDALAKTSDKLGIATEDLVGLRHAAQLTGNTTKNLELGIQRMTRRIAEAAQGSGEAKGALKELGLSAADLAKMTPDQQFRALAGSFKNVETQSDKVRLGFKLFDSEGVQLINTLALGADGLDAAAAEADKLGISFSRIDAAKVEDANDQLLRVGQVAKGLGQKLTVKLAPMISVISEKLIGAATEGDRMGKIITRAIGFAVKAVGVFANGIRGVKIIFAAVKLAADMFGAGVVAVFRTVIVGAVDAGNAIIGFVLTPLRKSIELAAKFSDSAKEALATLDAMTTIATPDIVSGMDAQLESLYGSISENREELQALLMADLPSAVIDQRWAEIQAEAEARAQETAAKIKANLAGGDGVTTEGEVVQTEQEIAAAEAKAQRERDQIAARLQRIDESHFTELEMLAAKLASEYEITAQARANDLIGQEEYEARLAQIKQRGEEAKTKLAATSEKARGAIVASSMGSIASAFTGGSKKQFKVQKAAALAQAAVALPASVIDAVKNAGGLPFGAWAGAATLTAGLAQIANIKKSSFGGGGGSISSSGGGGGSASSSPASAIAPSVGSQFNSNSKAEAPGRQVNITIAGDVVGDTAETILDKMRGLIEENDAVLFSSNSRQAQELATG